MTLDNMKGVGRYMGAILFAGALLSQPTLVKQAQADGLKGALPIAENFNPNILKQYVKGIIAEADKLRKHKGSKIKFIDIKGVIPVGHPDKKKFPNWYEALLQTGKIHNTYDTLHVQLCKGYKGNTGKDCTPIKDAAVLMRITELLRQATFTFAKKVCLGKNEGFYSKKLQMIRQAETDFADETIWDMKSHREKKVDLKAPGHIVYILNKYDTPISFDQLAMVLNLKYGSKFNGKKAHDKLNLRLSDIQISCHHNRPFLRSIVWTADVGNQFQIQKPGWGAFKFTGPLSDVFHAKKK